MASYIIPLYLRAARQVKCPNIMITRNISDCNVSHDYWIIDVSNKDLTQTNLVSNLDSHYFFANGLGLEDALRATITK